MPLTDNEQLEVIVNTFNDNKSVKLDGSERVDTVCKEVATNLYREWFMRTQAPMVEKQWSPVVIVSLHREEPPSAVQGDYYFKFKNEKERWGAYEFELPDSAGFLIVKYGVQWGKQAERACNDHFKAFSAVAGCYGINSSDKIRVEPLKENKDCTIF